MVEVAKALSLECAHPDHGRADVGADRASEIEELFAAIRRLTARGRLRHLHFAPPGGAGAGRPSGHGAARRPRRRHATAAGADPGARPADGEPRHLASITRRRRGRTRRGDPARRRRQPRRAAPRRELHAAPWRDPRRCRAARRRADRAGARDRRRRHAGFGPHHRRRQAGARARAARCDSRRASAWCPRIASARASCCRRASPPTCRCRSCSRLGRAGVVDRAGEEQMATRWIARAADQDPEPSTRGSLDAERRQPAEGGPRQMAGRRRRRPDRRRADARHRRRREDGDLRAARSSGRRRGRDSDDLVRPAGSAWA